jgi:nitrogenase molybdenum-iron protein alpha/beta subunit
MRIASFIVENIEGLSSLLIGMPECTTHSRLFSPKPENRHGELHWLYVLDAHEVVFGCRDGLMDALEKMDKAGVKAILLIVTCVPELIGEDIEGLIYEVQPKLSARVTFVMLGQFKNISYPPGWWKTMEAMGTLMDAKKTVPNRVNVLGRSPEEEHISMPSVLPALTRRDLALRYLASGASLADFQSAPDAALNLVVSPFMQALAAKMEREFGVPYIALHNLYDVESIDRTYGGLAERFGFSWDDAFEKERQKALALQNQAKERLGGLRYVFSLKIDVPIPLAVYLAGLGMEPLLLHLEEYYPEDKAYTKKLVSMGHNPWICRMMNAEMDVLVLEKLAFDLCFGYLPDTNRNIPYVPDMLDFYGQVGYDRTSNLLRRILDVLEEMDASGKGGG